MKDKPRILIIDNSRYLTGALKTILHFCHHTEESFEFIFVLPLNSEAAPYITRQGFQVLFLPFVELSKSWRNFLLYLPFLIFNAYRIKKIAHKNQVSIVHVNDFYNLSGIVAKAIGGKFKLLTHVRFMPNRFPSILVKIWMFLNVRLAVAVIAVSEAVKAQLPKSPKVLVVYDSLRQFCPVEREIKKDETLNLLYLAHYIPGKGQDLALEAFYKAFGINRNLRLKFVGADTRLKKNKAYKQKLLTEVKRLKLTEAVSFAGPTEEVNKEMALADIALNFSESESFSITCLEALKLGTPLIASDCGGPAELFEHDISGLLVPNKNIEAMCSAILHLAADEKKRLKFSRNSVKYVSQKFSPTVTFNKLSNIYREALHDL